MFRFTIRDVLWLTVVLDRQRLDTAYPEAVSDARAIAHLARGRNGMENLDLMGLQCKYGVDRDVPWLSNLGPKTPLSGRRRGKRALQLAMLMILGTVVGYVAAPFLVVALYGYDHGGETEELAVWTIPGGALPGLVAHLYWNWRRAHRHASS